MIKERRPEAFGKTLFPGLPGKVTWHSGINFAGEKPAAMDFKREREAEGYEPEPESTEYIASVYRLAEASPYASGAFL